jgi:hypothetical protein
MRSHGLYEGGTAILSTVIRAATHRGSAYKTERGEGGTMAPPALVRARNRHEFPDRRRVRDAAPSQTPSQPHVSGPGTGRGFT